MASELQPFGRALLVVGIILSGIGLVLLCGPKVPWLGRLPGDIAIRKDGFSFYLPLTSSLVISALVSLVLWVMSRFRS